MRKYVYQCLNCESEYHFTESIEAECTLCEEVLDFVEITEVAQVKYLDPMREAGHRIVDFL